MENIKYDQEVIQSFANTMYAKANRIILAETIKYGFLGGLALFVAAIFGLRNFDPSAFTYFLSFGFGSVIFGAYGYQAGQLKAFHLKLEAQRALCFAQMEKNTRNYQTEQKVA